MVQGKEIRVALALVAVVVGLAVSGTASALPEMEVGSHLVQASSTANAQGQPVDPADAEESESVDSDDEAETTSN
jgi:hypothetical protein